MPTSPPTLPMIAGLPATDGEMRANTAPSSARSRRGSPGRPPTAGGFNDTWPAKGSPGRPPTTGGFNDTWPARGSLGGPPTTGGFNDTWPARGSPRSPPTTGGFNETWPARSMTASPPSTVNGGSRGLGRTLPGFSPREVMQMVHNYWYPVEESVKSRHPQRLEAALKSMHGTQYMRTIHTVRRSTSLKAAERHAIEMELAARLVRARAVLGKWQAGKREIQGARDARDAERLDNTLEKWSFAEDDPEVAGARADLARWRHLAETLPDVLRDAVEKRDVEEIRRAVTELNTCGPAGVEGEIGARKILSKYDAQVKALRDAMNSSSAEAIELALQGWTFDRADPNIQEAHAMLQRREEQQQLLRTANSSLDGPALQNAVDTWGFERDDEDFIEAVGALRRYNEVSREVSWLASGTGNLPQLADVLNRWEFSDHDPVLLSARDQVEAYEEAVRTTLRSRDGWMMERLWTNGRAGRALPSSLQEEVSDLLIHYSQAVGELQDLMRSIKDSNSRMERPISKCIESWDFSQDDPNLGCAILWLRFHRYAQVQGLSAVRRATAAGDVFSLRRMLDDMQDRGRATRSELQAAVDMCNLYDEAVEVVGAVALGVEPDKFHGVLERSHELELVMRNLKTTVDAIEVKCVSELKRLPKPPRIVHAVLEMLLHVLAGVSPHVRDPPRDAEWRSCQKMVSNAAVLRANLLEVPNWIASGNLAGIRRARDRSQHFEAEFGDQWSLFGTRIKSVIAGQLFEYLEHLFVYAELIEANEDARGSDLAVHPLRRLSKASSSAKHCGTDSVSHGPFKRSKTEPVSTVEMASFHADMNACKHLRPLSVLQRVRRCLCRSIVLSIAWVLSGNDPGELQRCLQQKRKYLCATQAAVTVAGQMLANLVPDLVSTSEVAIKDRASVSETRRASSENAEAPTLRLTVKFLSGDVVETLTARSDMTVAELKERLGLAKGSSTNRYRLLYGSASLREGLSLDMQGVVDGANLLLLRLCPTLLEQLQDAAAEAVGGGATIPSATNKAEAAVSPLEPAAHLLYGSGSERLSAPPRKTQVNPEMLRVLRAASAVVSATPSARRWQELATSDVSVSSEPLTLDLEAVQSLRVPISNLAAARRAMADGECPLAVEKFVNVMHVFYNDFVPLRAAWLQALVCMEEAKAALRHAEEIADFAGKFERMDRPAQCNDVDDVVQATVRSLDQVQVLAKHGLALPAMHVEYVRMAIDSAGAHLLANPPCSEAGTRIRWSEAAMAIQLAPLPHFAVALSAMARCIDVEDLQAIGRQFGPEPEHIKLLSAVIWVVQADCRCNSTWSDVKRNLVNAQEFVQSLVDWSPVRDTSVARINHARGLLLGIWGWVASGCGGSKALGAVFAWVSLAVAMLPLSEMAQRLTPVYKAVKQGITKAERAPSEQQFLAKAKAWTAALFLLDGPGEHWWWLRLIRPSAHMDMPWTDAEDGGVGDAHAHEVEAQDDAARRWSPTGNGMKEGALDEEQYNFSPADESLQGSVDLEEGEEDDLDAELFEIADTDDSKQAFCPQSGSNFERTISADTAITANESCSVIHDNELPESPTLSPTHTAEPADLGEADDRALASWIESQPARDGEPFGGLGALMSKAGLDDQYAKAVECTTTLGIGNMTDLLQSTMFEKTMRFKQEPQKKYSDAIEAFRNEMKAAIASTNQASPSPDAAELAVGEPKAAETAAPETLTGTSVA